MSIKDQLTNLLDHAWDYTDKKSKDETLGKEDSSKMAFELLGKLGKGSSFTKIAFDKAFESVDQKKTKKVSKDQMKKLVNNIIDQN